MSVKLKTG